MPRASSPPRLNDPLPDGGLSTDPISADLCPVRTELPGLQPLVAHPEGRFGYLLDELACLRDELASLVLPPGAGCCVSSPSSFGFLRAFLSNLACDSLQSPDYSGASDGADYDRDLARLTASFV